MTVLALTPATQMDVDIAWATVRALILAEVDDPRLASDETHQRAVSIARERFKRLYVEWSRG